MQIFNKKYEIKTNDVYNAIRFLKEEFKTKGKIVERVSSGKYKML